MSSHHIVRENQEPALIIEDLHCIADFFLSQLLEWNPTIICGTGSLSSLRDKGIKIDVVISPKEIALPQDHIVYISAQGSFVEAALAYLIEKNYQAVNVVCGQPYLYLLPEYASRIDIALLNNGIRYYAVKSGFSKWKPGNEVVYLYGDEGNLQTKGLIKQENHQYRTASDGFFSLAFPAGSCIIGETL